MKIGASRHDFESYVLSSLYRQTLLIPFRKLLMSAIRSAGQTQRRPQPEDQLKHLRLPPVSSLIPKVKYIPKASVWSRVKTTEASMAINDNFGGLFWH